MVTMFFLLGLFVGSFIGALVWRLHKKRDWLGGRSECDHCQRRLSALDLIPVVGWIFLRGKCRYCKKPVSAEYPLLEIVTGGLFAVSFSMWNMVSPASVVAFTLWLMLVAVLLALAVYDLKYMLLPNSLITAVAVLAVLYLVVELVYANGNLSVIQGALLGALGFGGLFHILYWFSRGKWLGGGDVKLAYVLGAWLGSVFLGWLAIFIASAVGTVIALVLMARGKASLKTRLPFGPMLIAGFIVAQLVGVQILELYETVIVRSVLP